MAPRTLVLGFGGNAWNADALALFLRERHRQADIVAFHFRGYPPSDGAPSAEALLADALVVHDSVRDRFAPDRLVAVGFSLGSGVAAHLASRRPVDGLVLVSPFDSMAALGSGHYPWLPIRWLLRHRMTTAVYVGATAAPVALIAAGDDTLVPPERTAPVRAAARCLVFDRTIDRADHIDLYRHPAFAGAMAEALVRIGDTWAAGTGRAPTPGG